MEQKKLYILVDSNNFILSIHDGSLEIDDRNPLRDYNFETNILFDDFLKSNESITDGYHKYINGEIIKVDKLNPDEIPESLKESLRQRRETECFPIINRGNLWYDNLTETQKSELSEWYNAWLNVTETLIVPDKPEWLK